MKHCTLLSISPSTKTDEELKSERENLAENQLLIFKRNSYIDSMQTEKFASALQTIAGSTTGYHSLEPLVGQLREIYRTGVLLLPDEWQSRADTSAISGLLKTIWRPP